MSGFAGEHPERRIEAAAAAPYPLAGDVAINGMWLSDAPHQVQDLEQAYDFSNGELTSAFTFTASGLSMRCEVLTFASREDPTLVCQELSISVESACDLQVKSMVDATNIPGRALRQMRATPGESEPACDGTLLWESAGGLGKVGLAHVSEMLGGAAAQAEPKRTPLEDNRLATTFQSRARQSAVSASADDQRGCGGCTISRTNTRADGGQSTPDAFDTIALENKVIWERFERPHHPCWRGKVGAALADAAVFYLNSSVHASRPPQRRFPIGHSGYDYHYYYGHASGHRGFRRPVLAFSRRRGQHPRLPVPCVARAHNNARALWAAAALNLRGRVPHQRGTRLPHFQVPQPGMRTMCLSMWLALSLFTQMCAMRPSSCAKRPGPFYLVSRNGLPRELPRPVGATRFAPPWV